MQYKELLKENNAFDFESNSLEVKEATVNQKTKGYDISLIIENALVLDQYLSFISRNRKIFFNMGIDNLTIKIKYRYQKLSDKDLIDYYKYVVNDLIVRSSFFKVFLDLKVDVAENCLSLLIDHENETLKTCAKKIEEELKKLSLDISIVFIESEEVKSTDEIKAEIDNEMEMELKSRQALASQYEDKKDIKLMSKKRQNYSNMNVSKISDIPSTQQGMFEYQENFGEAVFVIEATIFAFEMKKFTNCSLATIKVTDYSDSIVVKKFLKSDADIEMFNKLGKDDVIRIKGKAQYDTFLKNVVIMADSISYTGHETKKKRNDLAEEKRVELHCHSKMSNLDSVSDAVDYMKQAEAWGWKAMAITDHNGVYAIPDILHAKGSAPNVKPIYGVELNYIDDSKISITYGPGADVLKEATYTVFDLETTGLSQTNDRIIEIAAVKVTGGAITEKYETFVNPERKITEKIVNLTSINEDMVKDAPKIEQALKEFLEFSKDTILVAHNASFDIGMIKANMKRLGYEEIDFKGIDTLNLCRAMYANDLKKFNLKAISKYFKVRQDQHHRAIDDTRVTAECFVLMLLDLYKKGINKYSEINTVIDKKEMWKHIIPNHLSILVKNQNGYKNMFKILSDALTNHLYGEPRLLKSVLKKYRDGILLGSGCVNGEVFELALNRSEEEMLDAMDMYDYIEVQPPLCYAHLFNEMLDGEKVIKETIKKIINGAIKLNKIVVATSDAHYIDIEQKKYRDILIASPQIGGGQHALARYESSPVMYLRTTNEMLEEFNFIDPSLAKEIVVTNTNLIADMIEDIRCFYDEMFVPADDEFKDTIHVPSMIGEMRNIVSTNIKKKYGDKPHFFVSKRVDRELESIIKSGYYSTYFMAYLLVKKSLEDGYLVGSRGSVGSSLVATMMNITEINPLPPHYVCPKCHFTAIKFSAEEQANIESKEEADLQEVLNSVESGFDLPDMVCPICGAKLHKDGHDIPFETFLGFDGDKVPDIDLNFSGEYQAKAHEYVRFLMGNENAFRGGTVGTVAEKNAYGYVKAYVEKKGLNIREAEIDRLSSTLVGVKRSTGQHPGGIVVVPKRIDIYDVTPIQYPADNTENAWRTTHFDYHAFENNLLKLDILGHDDPTMIRYFMDYVHNHQDDFPFTSPQDIPVDDKFVYKLFCGTEPIKVDQERILSKVASYAVPELGTNFVRQMLNDTLPKTFAGLVKISGLSHGTGVWLGNSQTLVNGNGEYGKIPFSNIIGCRDDIMVDLQYDGVEPLKAFKIMEFVRKGKVKKDPKTWEGFKSILIEKKVPAWYIWSCEQIEYMFPKAHATAYVLMALRIAWFKVYSPVLFYSAYFSKRAKAYDALAFVGGEAQIKTKLLALKSKNVKVEKDEDLITSLEVALEMTSRGYKFLPVDIEKSDAVIFQIEDGALRIPFIAIDGLGESVALDIIAKRKERPFSSKKDVTTRTRLNATLSDLFDKQGIFGDLPDEDPEVAQGLFALL